MMILHKPKITLFDLTNPQHKTAAELFNEGNALPIISPHGHINPWLFADENARFTDPASLFIIPDHYVVRMLVSHGLTFDQLGIFPQESDPSPRDPRAIWQLFCDHFFAFDGTPTGMWIENALAMVFGIDDKPTTQNAMEIYDLIQEALDQPGMTPRQLYHTFNIEVLCTTDDASDRLGAHRVIRSSGWKGNIKPTFRVDNVVHIEHQGWQNHIHKLSQVCQRDIYNYANFVQAIEDQRAYFKSMGAVATDLSVRSPFTCRLSPRDADQIFQKGMKGTIDEGEADRFIGNMVIELARMSAEDGLVMQLRAGPYRNYAPFVFETYGADRGFDIPVRVEWVRNLKPLLNEFGFDRRLKMILFTLDESSYARELAPLAGAFPTIKLGPPWWFYDSPNGMMRYFDGVMETAGIDNTVGFNDDTSAFLSIPARHDLWRRMSASWLAKLFHQGQIDRETAGKRMADLSYHLAKRGYEFEV